VQVRGISKPRWLFTTARSEVRSVAGCVRNQAKQEIRNSETGVGWNRVVLWMGQLETLRQVS
jgi:hypothetical protein